MNAVDFEKEQSVSAKEVYKRLFQYLKPHWKIFGLGLLSMTLYGVTDGIVPFLIQKILDDIFGQQNKAMLWWLVGILFAFAIVRGGASFLQQYLSARVGLNIVRDIRNEISSRLLGLSTSFFGRNQSGSLISTMTNDTLLVRTALTDAIASLLRDSIRVVSLAAAAIYLDPMLGLIALIGFPLGIIPVIKFGKRVRRLSRIGQEQFGGLTAVLHEIIQGHKVVQSFGMEKFEQERFARENSEATETLLKAQRYGAMTSPINEIIASLATAGVIVYGGLSVMNGVRTQGQFIAFLAALFLMYDPLKRLGRINTMIQAGVAASQRVFHILDTNPEITDSPNATDIAITQPRIEYRDVWFRYNESWALRGVSFEIRAGETIALVGMSGGGKSTIVNLLPRFYDPLRGEILISGQNIRNVTLRSLRQSISIVSQHTFLFNTTVLNNIRYGRSDATFEEVVWAAKAAHAHEFITRLPDGYDTPIGEQGLSLSGGERARIAIARAILKNSPILILDEATAALDSESEKLVQDALDRVMDGRTTLVIAHRLATVMKASKIVVVTRGQIAESGTHEELLKLGGEYSKLYRIQFRAQSEESESEPESLAVGA